MNIPRPEYPRPQFVRKDWLCLNGEWQFEIDCGNSGIERGLKERELTNRILVPFCPESELSGIGNVDFMNVVWYRKEVKIPEDWKGRDVLLHFQACDYDTTVWVNSVEVTRHRGGFTPFTCDLTGIAGPGETAVIVVRARDNDRGPLPRGKQSNKFENWGCFYTRTTGIWQTVWMEPVPDFYLKRPRITPNVGYSRFEVLQPLRRPFDGGTVRLTAKDKQGVVCMAETKTGLDFSPRLCLDIPADRLQLWSHENPFLYDLEIELLDANGMVIDSATSYAGMRSVTIDGMAVKINGKTVFQRLVLDQGYYENGIMTAPSDEALVKDIELSIAAGFNGARLHQKVFEERFLYHADRLGYLVWGEFADWGHGLGSPRLHHQNLGATYITQWIEAVERDYSHPSIIGWCGLNESFEDIDDYIHDLDDVTRGMFLAAKALDGTRPVLDASGYAHRVRCSDIYDSHDYNQDPAEFKKIMAPLSEGKPFINDRPQGARISIDYGGQPYFVSEFGGIRWNPEAAESDESWGYGDAPKTIEEFYARFEGLCNVLLDDPNMFGYCYTHLTDVFQEQNGIYFFDRSLKFDMDRIRKIQTRTAAIEKA